MHRSVTQRALMEVDDQYPRLAVFQSTDPISYRFVENRWGDPEVNGLPSWRGANWRFGVFIPLPSKTFLNLYLSQLISYVTVNPKFANLLLSCHRMCLPFHSGHSERLRQYGNRRWSTFVDFHLEPYHEWTNLSKKHPRKCWMVKWPSSNTGWFPAAKTKHWWNTRLKWITVSDFLGGCANME